MNKEKLKTQTGLILILWLITNFLSDNTWINSTALVTAFLLINWFWCYLENKENIKKENEEK